MERFLCTFFCCLPHFVCEITSVFFGIFLGQFFRMSQMLSYMYLKEARIVRLVNYLMLGKKK